MTRLFLLLFVALLSGSWSIAQSKPDTLSAKVDALFKEWAGPGRPGAAVGVVHGGKLIYAKGFGEADVETGAPIRVRNLWLKRLPDDFDAGESADFY